MRHLLLENNPRYSMAVLRPKGKTIEQCRCVNLDATWTRNSLKYISKD